MTIAVAGGYYGIFFMACFETIVMSDDKNKKGPQDRSRISLSEDYEVRYWSEKFGISSEELKRVVNKVGPSARAVEEALKGR